MRFADAAPLRCGDEDELASLSLVFAVKVMSDEARRDIARRNPVAGQIQHVVFLIGDCDARACLVVDLAWRRMMG